MTKNNRTLPERKQIYQPFNAEQLAAIAAHISADEPTRTVCVERIVVVVRRYLIVRKTEDTTKVQARDELFGLLETTTSLQSQLSNLGVGARVALDEAFILNGGSLRDISYSAYLSEIYLELKLLHDFVRGAHKIAAAKVNDGPKPNTALRKFFSEAKQLFGAATGTKRGFWAFFHAVCKPLNRTGLTDQLSCDDPDKFKEAWKAAVRVRS